MKNARYPVVLKILLPLVSGILASTFYPVDVPILVVFGVLALLVISSLLKFRNGNLADSVFSILLFLLFGSVGIFLANNADSSKNRSYFSNSIAPDTLNYLHLELDDNPIISEKWIKCETKVVALNDNSTTGKIQVYVERDSLSQKLRYGDQLYATGFLTPIQGPMNPHEFDYRAYMQLYDIHHQIFIKSKNWKLSGNDANPIFETVYTIRNACAGIFDRSGMAPENIAVAKALVIGDKALISDELMLSYASTGALHVLAVSGLHVGIIMLILGFVLKPIRRIKHGTFLFLLLALGGIWFYAVLTGLSPSVLRAAVMFSFVLIGNETQKDTSIYQSLMVSATILILFDPLVIFHLGFLLSYLAVAGIVFFHPRIYSLLYFKNKIADKIWQISCVSIAAQLATFPLSIYCFQQFPNYFLIANLIVIPLSFIILILGIFALFVSSIPIVSTITFLILEWLIYFLNEGVRFVENLPYAVFDSLVITWYDSILLYLVLILTSYALIKKSKIVLHFSFAVLSLFFVSNLISVFNKNDIKQVVFYHVKNQITLDIFTGRNFSTLSTISDQKTNSEIKFHIEPNRLQCSGNKSSNSTEIIDETHDLFTFENKTILFANQNQLDSIYQTDFPKTDAVYFYECTFIQDDLLTEFQGQKTLLIFGHDCAYGLKKYLSKSIQSDYLYDISKSGALILRF